MTNYELVGETVGRIFSTLLLFSIGIYIGWKLFKNKRKQKQNEKTKS